jgi:1-acyl-sn-glycerol-3-phosphate acyltransferase
MISMKIWFYKFARSTVRKYFNRKYRLEVVNADVVPATGGLILACNHVSYLDPPLIGVSIFQRMLHFIARGTLFNNPAFGALISVLNAVPIARGQGPNQDWGRFTRLLDRGAAILIFPEGTRSEDGQLQRGKSGFGRLVYMAQKPVYPIYIQGAYEAYPKHGKQRRVPITVVFGPPVELGDLFKQGSEKRVLREISERTMAAIAQLKTELEAKQAAEKKGGEKA